MNSIDWNEQILISENDKIIVKPIGEYIDNKINENINVTRPDDNKEYEMGDIYHVDTSKENIYTISVNEDGKMSWNKITALTKHLPINKDGTSDLVKIMTRLGRTVTATKAKSFLTRIDNKVIPVRGDEILVGMKVPIIMKYPDPIKIINELDLSEYFSKYEYIFGSEIEKAKQFKQSQHDLGKRIWFKKYHGILFTTPYSRQDSLQAVLDGKNNAIYKNNCIYSRACNNREMELPEKIHLDKEFGFFVGAYLAEGLATKNYIAISNNDEKFRKRIADLCDIWKVGYHIQEQKDKIQIGWTSTDIRIHSVILARLMKQICNTGSEFKIIPSFAFNAPLDFVRGLLNGYFSGDGTISDEKMYISCTSISEKMIDGIAILLTRFSIISKKNKPTKITHNNRGSQDIKQHYNLTIRNENIHIFEKEISMLTETKKIRLQNLLKYTFNYGNGVYDTIPGNNLDCLQGTTHRNKIKELCMTDTITIFDKNILQKVLDSNVYYDDIVTIETVKPSHNHVYDLTVNNDKTFVLYSGIACYDTFHSVGIKSSTSLGVPRVKELLSLSKNMKTPEMTIYLTKQNKNKSDIANKIASHLKHTIVMDVRKKIDIYYDPSPLDKGSFMDKDNVANVFYSHNPSKNSCQGDVSALPWLLRIELDREKMMEKDVTLLDIKAKYCNNWEKRYSDVKGQKKEERTLLERITQTSILSNSDNDAQPIIHIRFDMSEFDFTTLVSFIDIFVDNFKLKGVEYINKIIDVSDEPVITFDNEDEELKKEKQFVIYTGGVNLQDIRYLNGIDLNRTTCNDIMSIYETYGIDAARAALIKEFKIVFAGAGSKVNFAHIEILCDLITNTGVPTSIDRHGMNKSETDPLARASFEKTVDQLLTAAVFSEIDNMNNVSSRIMAGLVIKGGTGLCEVILDSDLLEKSEYTDDIEQTYVKTYNEVSTSSVMADVMNKESVGFFVPE